MKYVVTDDVDEILKIAMLYKRNEEYLKANNIYEKVFQLDGPSVPLYKSWAKTLACQGKYEDAIILLREIVNDLEKNKIYDEACEMHLFMLENRNNIIPSEFLRYMRSISGNPNYELIKFD